MFLATEFAVVGGSYAGLSAALQLARARRQVLVIDAGQRRNRFVDDAGAAAHGFLGQDGRAPAAIAADARAQLLRYAGVRWIDGHADDAGLGRDGGLQPVRAARLILATGVRDVLPEVPGLAERWGRSVFHCPYCHGHEAGERIGIVAASALAVHQALMLPDWAPTTLFLNGVEPPDPQQAAALARRGARIEPVPIQRIDGVADVLLADGRRLPMTGLFTQPRVLPASPLAEQLGCAMAQGPMGPYVEVREGQATGVPNVFACGDAARPAGNIALAVADGAMAGFGAHRAAMGF
ncbi:NAD(P)/FAD-dependent oxidoreductase [Piscinibacter sakaiensis]|uniref:NAD(P)/FAD-dependent oxidoreductase n=1 Tax=Piscinibacter sakaiensis TaxID=1547922 RepID=UPI003726D8A9